MALIEDLIRAGPYTDALLVHIPTRRILVTLSRQKDCAMLAAELMPLRINWDETDPEKVVQGTPDQKRIPAGGLPTLRVGGL